MVQRLNEFKKRFVFGVRPVKTDVDGRSDETKRASPFSLVSHGKFASVSQRCRG
jgi:hypothetical protein